jgi:hypothetical protein
MADRQGGRAERRPPDTCAGAGKLSPMRLPPVALTLCLATAAACVPSADYATSGEDGGSRASPSPWPPPDGAPVPPDTPVPSTGAPLVPTAKVAAPAGTTLFVAEALVDCQGEGPMKCMRVRTSEDQPWSLHYDRIEGFTYEPGFVYELRVERRDVAKPAADAPSSRYRLLELVSRRKVGAAP